MKNWGFVNLVFGTMLLVGLGVACWIYQRKWFGTVLDRTSGAVIVVGFVLAVVIILLVLSWLTNPER
jgi:Ca2+/Na+ antiporter